MPRSIRTTEPSAPRRPTATILAKQSHLNQLESQEITIYYDVPPGYWSDLESDQQNANVSAAFIGLKHQEPSVTPLEQKEVPSLCQSPAAPRPQELLPTCRQEPPRAPLQGAG